MLEPITPIDYWRFHDGLTVIQAALLILSEDPSLYSPNIYRTIYNEHGEGQDYKPPEYDAVFSGITKAINSNKLAARLRYRVRTTLDEYDWVERTYAGYDEIQHEFSKPLEGEAPDTLYLIYKAAPDWTLTTVEVEDLKKWLISRNFRPAFFFPTATDAPDYLNPEHPRYAPKLAAATRAWQAVTDPKGKSPKQALIKWLRENAADFGLSDDEGRPNETGIDEAAKVANWQLGGGASRTPGE